jgi:hypothetical protein
MLGTLMIAQAVTLSLSACAIGAAADANSLIAYYTFDEGSGEVLHDRSGHGHNGRIIGARWVRQGDQSMLRFDGSGDYVDFGNNRDLKLTGDLTILAWVHLDASPYPDDATNWTIVDCEEYRQEGFILRIDGAASKVLYRVSQKGTSQEAFGVTAMKNHKAYLIAVTRRGDTATVYVDGIPDVRFAVKDPLFGSVPFKISSTGQSFNGSIGEVMIFKRALMHDEIAGHYWREAARYGKNTSKRGQLRIEPFIHDDEKQAIAEVDFFGVLPLANGERVVVELARRGSEALCSQEVVKIPEQCKGEYTFALESLPRAEYELRAILKGSGRTVRAASGFSYPAPPVVVPSPTHAPVGPLPTQPAAPEWRVAVTGGGGFTLAIAGRSFRVESTFSFPNGGENKLVCAPAQDKTGEADWDVTSAHPDSSTCQLQGRGKSYAISRRMTSRPGRVLVSDTITNATAAPLGILFSNRLVSDAAGIKQAHLAGKLATTPVDDRDLKTCPTIFFNSGGLGLGMVALDDVYIVQSRGSFDGQSVAIASKEFALDAGASYTLEWAIYANTTGDYYDLINAVRRDEGRNNVTVEGELALLPQTQQRRDVSLVPNEPFYRIRNAAYATIYCLSWCTDDPAISVEGIEFIEFPKERQRIRAMMDALKSKRPDIKGMFHVAQQLYATNRPNDYYQDSRVIDAEGRHAVYPYEYANGNYFSRERYEQNWRWWIYYPTLENSFGKAMLRSIDVMMDEMGCRGVFVDGFLWGYGGEYTYDRWDGHTADIDPKTKTITRKKASVLLLTQDAMIAYCRKVWSKGGVVIANNVVPTRTICSQPLIMDKEISEGPYAHLLTTPIAMGNPGAIRSEVDVYRDVRSKLSWGNLYFYYGEPATLTYESVPKRMYPITVQEIHSGYVKGKERLITMHSGVYGWPGDRDLHMAYRYDSRGHRIRADYITTVDASSVRTQVDLRKGETAVLERIPVRIESPTPMNVNVERYDEQGLVITVNGKGAIKVIPTKGKPHEVQLDGQQRITLPGRHSN